MKKSLMRVLFSLILVITALVIYLVIDDTNPVFTYDVSSEGAVTIKVSSPGRNKYFIAIDSNPETNENTDYKDLEFNDEYPLNLGENYIHIKDEKGIAYPIDDYRTLFVLGFEGEYLPFYPIDDVIEPELIYCSIGPADFNMSSDNENVIEVKGNKLYTKAKGTSTITTIINDQKVEKTFEVTDLYTKPDYNSADKPFLKELLITDSEEAKKLDEILRLQIEEAGYGTRAGVVAAARFLSLEFPYKLAYFSEAGRLDPESTAQSDGEGRYYHTGLFLSEDKFDILGPSIFGRATWGQFFREDTSNDHSLDDYYLYDGFVPADIGSQLYLSKRPNGLDCSGFVSWAYLNGGFDFGDLGAGGPGGHGMNELGEFAWISDELLQSKSIKAGDLVGFAGHIGIVIGVEDDYIWIADNLISGLKVTKYERTKESFDELGHNAWQYFMLMDDEYLEDGNYTAMWEE